MLSLSRSLSQIIKEKKKKKSGLLFSLALLCLRSGGCVAQRHSHTLCSLETAGATDFTPSGSAWGEDTRPQLEADLCWCLATPANLWSKVPEELEKKKRLKV